MSESVDDLENQQNKKAQEMLRFLLQDDAFSVEFLITAIQEYVAENNVDRNPRGIGELPSWSFGRRHARSCIK